MRALTAESEVQRVLASHEVEALAIAADQYQTQAGDCATPESVSEFADVIWLTAAQKMQLLGSRVLTAVTLQSPMPGKSEPAKVSAQIVPIHSSPPSRCICRKRKTNSTKQGINPGVRSF